MGWGALSDSGWRGRIGAFAEMKFGREIVFEIQIYIYIYVCVCIYNLHLIVRPTSESKNEMGPHVVTHCQVAATGMGCSVHGGAEGTQTQST